MSRLRVTVPRRFIHVEKVDGFSTEPSPNVIPSGMLSTRMILWQKFGGAGSGEIVAPGCQASQGSITHPPHKLALPARVTAGSGISTGITAGITTEG